MSVALASIARLVDVSTHMHHIEYSGVCICLHIGDSATQPIHDKALSQAMTRAYKA